VTAIFGAPSRRDRLVVVSGLTVVTASCWAFLFLLAARMGSMGSPLSMPMTSEWSVSDVGLMWTMWAVMMAGMMLPSAVPMITAYARTVGSGRSQLRGSTPMFGAGYVVAWSSFAALGTAAQWWLHDAALVDALGVSQSNVLGGAILVGAGLYQFSGLKNACLAQCRSPLGFLLNEWRDGAGGAAVMGLRHGMVCIGCCWALMAMLFVLGVMNLWWIAVVAALVSVEKLAPSRLLTPAVGGVLLLWGVALISGIGLGA
jgi:predicted metal-binding membrane protein